MGAPDDPVGHHNRLDAMPLDELKDLPTDLRIRSNVALLSEPAFHLLRLSALPRHNAHRDLCRPGVVGTVESNRCNWVSPEATSSLLFQRCLRPSFYFHLNTLSLRPIEKPTYLSFSFFICLLQQIAGGQASLLKGCKLVGFMKKAGGYFFGHGARRSKPGLDSPPDRQCLDRAKDCIRVHTAEFVTP